MVFACCFGGGGGDVDAKRKPQSYGGPVELIGKTGKGQDFSELPSGGTTKTGATFLSGNTASLSAVTSTDNSSVAYQLNILSSALAGLSGNWYERVSSAATRLTKVSGAALCSVSILDAGHDKFTVVHVTGKDPECVSICPMGSQLPALQAAASVSHHHQPTAHGELRYNSVQVLQLLQTPLLYSFSDPIHGSREMKQPPYDWQAMYGTRGLSDFCALPLMYDKSVAGAVTLVFSPPAATPTATPTGVGRPLPAGIGAAGGMAALLMCCDEQSLRTLGLLLSVLLAGQDLKLAQQVADILAGVHGAKNLQQVVTAISAGAERVLQLQTRVAVNVTLAMLPGALATAAAAAGGASAGLSWGESASGGGSLRAIFFEERAAAASGGSGAGIGPGGGGGGMPRPNTAVEAHGDIGAATSGPAGPCNGAQPSWTQGRPGTGGGTGGGGIAPRGVRIPGVGVSLSHDGLSAVNVSQGSLLWQASLVQARALSLRHTLLANLPSVGTIVHDCASYMQQVGCPKRDLYLLSACNGAPPYSLAIAPAPLPLLRAGGGGSGDVAGSASTGADTHLVLYAAVAMRLPLELLGEILAQAQQLAVQILAPLLGQKLTQGSLAEEWALLLGKCSAGRGGGGGGGAAAAPTDAADVQWTSTSGLGTATGGGAAGGANTAAAEADGDAGDAAGRGGGTAATADAAAAAAADAEASGSTGPDRRGKAAPPPPSPSAAGAPACIAADDAAGSQVPSTSVATGAGASRSLSAARDSSRELQATVLSTAIAGAFAGDTRTHMGMLVSSFKDTINALQAFRIEEAEELSVLKLGKVLGRGGSGLVFQGYLHMGLEVAVKLFENPDDTDPDAGPSSNHDARANALSLEGSSAAVSTVGGAAAGAAGGDGGAGGASAASKDAAAAGGGGGGAQHRALSKTSAAQMTKRQRDLLRNALELGVTSSLSHPNIVQGYCHWVNVVLMQDASLNRCWLMGQAEYTALAPPGSPPPPLCSALVMEYCDMGSLIHALKRGTFATQDGKPNLEFVYMCLLEIALALRHLHTAKLAHCDLKPGNVLLRSSPRDPRGFVCKLGDFGYAAILKDGLLPGRPAVLPEEACGTLQYMAPELFVAGRPVDASIDIYAFGMLMWELITGRTPYSEGDYPSRSLMKAVYHGKRPGFPESTLAAYKNLAMCCWSGDSNLRPSASVLVKLLRQQLESHKQQSSNASSTSTAGSRT